MTFLTSWNDIWNARTYEPQKRWVGGAFGWARHRFPIKGGISLRETMIRDFSNQPRQWAHLFKSPVRVGDIVTIRIGND